MTTDLKPPGLHLHWPSLVHEHLCGDEDHAHVIKGGCRNAPGIETILLGDEIPEGQVGKFFAACPIHGADVGVRGQNPTKASSKSPGRESKRSTGPGPVK